MGGKTSVVAYWIPCHAYIVLVQWRSQKMVESKRDELTGEVSSCGRLS